MLGWYPPYFLAVYASVYLPLNDNRCCSCCTHTCVCCMGGFVACHVASPRICNAPLRWSSPSSSSSRSATDWLARSCRGRVFRIARVLKLWVPGTRYAVPGYYALFSRWQMTFTLSAQTKKNKYTEKLCAICLDVKDIFGICGMWCSAALSTWCQLTYDILLLLLSLSVLQHLPQVRTDIATRIEAWQLLFLQLRNLPAINFSLSLSHSFYIWIYK